MVKCPFLGTEVFADKILEQRLGILIKPSQVRLKTETTDDPYLWERIEEKEHLFDKNLSELSTAALEELFEAVEKCFIVAVPKPPKGDLQSGSMKLDVFHPI